MKPGDLVRYPDVVFHKFHYGVVLSDPKPIPGIFQDSASRLPLFFVEILWNEPVAGQKFSTMPVNLLELVS